MSKLQADDVKPMQIPVQSPMKSEGGGGGFQDLAPSHISMGLGVEFMGVSEDHCAEVWGISRVEVLRPFRNKKLEKDVDWFRESKIIYLRKTGVEKIALAHDLNADELWGQATVSKNLRRTEELVTVKSCPRGGNRFHFLNPKLIQCERDNGELIMVEVRNSQNYRPNLQSGQPMRLKAQLDEDKRWRHYGRDPRTQGRW